MPLASHPRFFTRIVNLRIAPDDCPAGNFCALAGGTHVEKFCFTHAPILGRFKLFGAGIFPIRANIETIFLRVNTWVRNSSSRATRTPATVGRVTTSAASAATAAARPSASPQNSSCEGGIVLHSPARRAFETAEIISEGAAVDLVELEELYWGDEDDLIRMVPLGDVPVLVVGHAPSIPMAASMIAAGDGPDLIAMKGCPTATTYVFDIPPGSERAGTAGLEDIIITPNRPWVLAS